MANWCGPHIQNTQEIKTFRPDSQWDFTGSAVRTTPWSTVTAGNHRYAGACRLCAVSTSPPLWMAAIVMLMSGCAAAAIPKMLNQRRTESASGASQTNSRRSSFGASYGESRAPSNSTSAWNISTLDAGLTSKSFYGHPALLLTMRARRKSFTIEHSLAQPNPYRLPSTYVDATALALAKDLPKARQLLAARNHRA